MEADEILRQNESDALDNPPFEARVTGKSLKISGKSGRFKGAKPALFATAAIVLLLIIVGKGNLVPTAVSERLIEETDVQYADAVESKKLVFQQAMYQGEIPENTAKLLEENGVEVGYISKNAFIDGSRALGELANAGEFVQGNRVSGELVLKVDGKIITAGEFINEVNHNVRLYDAFTKATYGRAAYYYDETAEKIIRKIGTSRNNFRENQDFDTTMNKVMGDGSNINVNSVIMEEKTRKNEQTGKEETYLEYNLSGKNAKSDEDAKEFMNETLAKSAATDEESSTVNSATFLNIADTVAKEQRSSLFYLLFMENISMMKAGDGNKSKLNDAMNFLYERKTTEVVDTETTELVEVTGAPLESPSLYAVMSSTNINVKDVRNYASDRILRTVGNQMDDANILPSTEIVASTSNKTQGNFGRLTNGSAVSGYDSIAPVEKTISSSLVNNSYDTIQGIDAGEFLVEGAVNVGKALAKGSGASAGDANAVTDYARLNQSVLAMDARVDRMNRSPFDITSKNTFLGSIVYKFAMSSIYTKNSLFSGMKKFSTTLSSAIVSLLPGVYADTAEGYLTTFGDCKTHATMIGAVSSPQCSEIATFDTSTLDDPFNNNGFLKFVEENTELNSAGARVVKKNSKLSKYILYNDERVTPLGVMDGGILESLESGSSRIPLVSGLVGMVKTFLGASDQNKRIASGEAFVNTGANPDWQEYKYAQRYVSLARATAVLRKSSGNSTAYNNIRFFEGAENPVVAFLADYYASK